MTQQGKVYQAINSVAEDLSKIGISKDRKGTGQYSYNFRGIDDVYASLSPLLAKHKLCILPNVLERTCETHTSKSGGTLFYVSLKVRFDLVSSEDGSIHQIQTFGESMDSGDKATNKAMSAAYKYAAFMTFCIPTEGDNDSENQTYEVAPKKTVPPNLKNDATEFAKQIDACRSLEDLTKLTEANSKLIADLHTWLPDWYERLMQKISENQEAFLLAEAEE